MTKTPPAELRNYGAGSFPGRSLGSSAYVYTRVPAGANNPRDGLELIHVDRQTEKETVVSGSVPLSSLTLLRAAERLQQTEAFVWVEVDSAADKTQRLVKGVVTAGKVEKKTLLSGQTMVGLPLSIP